MLEFTHSLGRDQQVFASWAQTSEEDGHLSDLVAQQRAIARIAERTGLVILREGRAGGRLLIVTSLGSKVDFREEDWKKIQERISSGNGSLTKSKGGHP